MGDHRANIKLEFTIHSKTYKHEFEWINYFPDDNGIDQRIVDWFEECWQDAYSRYNEKISKIREEQNKEQIEAAEKALLKKLQAKYGSAT